MDVPPGGAEERSTWETERTKITAVLEKHGLRYFRCGRVLPNGVSPEDVEMAPMLAASPVGVPTSVEKLLHVIVAGLPRAMYPLTNRRKGAQVLTFESEYDIQDLLHALMRPWIKDIRPEEYTPSYAGSSTRVDFLLKEHRIVLELKFVRDDAHARRIGNELIIDIDHYRSHPDCDRLWCIIFDPRHLLPNPGGLKSDLEGRRESKGKAVVVKVVIVPPAP